MNDRKLGNKVRQDVDKVKKDINTLVEDSASQLSSKFEKLTDEARETVVGAATSMKKDVGHGLSQYNAKAQDVANKVSGGFARQVARYPWVAMSISLAVGFLLGSLLKPARHSLE
jgi:ElaB/YqjD/DUF883 family membrane-anchored ribosome-binding protein